jgi:POLQ-like helicase
MNSRKKAKEWIFPRNKEFETELRISSSKWFKKNGFKVHSKMPYCLDKLENWKNNIVLPEVAYYIENYKNQSKKNEKPFPLHKYAHHGLSSQAMVFNLIGPLVVRNDLVPLIKLLESKGILGNFKNAEFEYEDRSVFNEDTGQPTSIDLVLLDISVQTVPPISVYECQAFRSISATHFGSNDATIPVLTVPL